MIKKVNANKRLNVNESYLVKPDSVGLKPHQYQLIEDIVLNYALVTHDWVFGSRVLGTYKDNSDIDIVMRGTVFR